MRKQFTKEFKEDAVRYYLAHSDLGLEACSKNLGASKSSLSTWIKNANENHGTVNTRGSGNFESDEAKENARLRKELRDTNDALDILKKAINILGN